ncbi:homogentisate phytyltransferase [Pantanalinema rosaneae CENA516]|uniref:homogentisate phytyltransferase n=1 Tax=Pantanalinema rosaneae TaxID=1620701 RepID=UPI003D6F712E
MSRTFTSTAPQTTSTTSEPQVQSPVERLYAFWKFSRPHTIIGTTLSVVGLSFLAGAMQRSGTGFDLAALPPFSTIALALAACLCGNLYIVGLNQIEDVAIDRINKPHLPLASGEYSQRQAVTIVSIAGILALILAGIGGGYLLATVGVSLIIGTAYSLPPIRLKRFPFWASFCILSVRGAIVNLGLFLHFHPGLPIPSPVWTLTGFILVFTFAIAIFKDVPDLEGDRQYRITTFTLKLGQVAVFNLTRWVLTACYLGIVAAALLGVTGSQPFVIITIHLGILASLWQRSLHINLQDKRSISRFYQFIWKLFFLEYLLFPIVCWLNH